MRTIAIALLLSLSFFPGNQTPKSDEKRDEKSDERNDEKSDEKSQEESN